MSRCDEDLVRRAAAIGALLVGALLGWPGSARAAAGASAGAGTPDGTLRLVHDFYPGIEAGGPPPQDLRSLGGVTFFIAEDRERPSSVWRTDGTPANTAPVPHAVGSAPTYSPRLLGASGGRMLWSAVIEEEETTALFAAGAQGPAVRLPTHAVGAAPQLLAGRLYFLDCEGTACAIWSSDGTAAGTGPLVAGAGEPAGALLGTFAGRWLAYRRGAALHAWDVERGRRELLLPDGGNGAAAYPLRDALILVTVHERARVWVSRLAAPRAEQLFSGQGIHVAGWTDDRLYFAPEYDHYVENHRLWSTDGTRAGTRSYHGFVPEAYSLLADRLGTLADTTFLPMPGYYVGGLMAARESKGRVREVLRTCTGKYSCLGSSGPSNVLVVGERGFLTIDGELYETDGTPAGTHTHQLLERAHGGTMLVHGGDLLVGATSAAGESGLWETDGPHTRLLAGGVGEQALRLRSQPLAQGDGWLAAATRGLADEWGQSMKGPQLFALRDGAVTQLTALRHVGIGVDPSYAAVAGERRIISSGYTAVGVGPEGDVEDLPGVPGLCGDWSSDGISICPSPDLQIGGRLLFVGTGGLDWSSFGTLWASDGTTAGTVELGEDSAEPALFDVVALGPLGDRALAIAGDGSLWATDGTSSGTMQIGALPALHDELRTEIVGPPIALGGMTFFFRRVPDHAPEPDEGNTGVVEVWRSDGTQAGTFHLADLPFDDDTAMFTGATVVAGRLFFRLHGRLWSSDGSVAGTAPLDEQFPGGIFGIAAGASLLYAGGGYLEGFEGPQTLWAIDPLTFSRRAVGSFFQLAGGGVGELGSVVGDALLFSAYVSEDEEDSRWWVSEGDEGSTHAVGEPLSCSDGTVPPGVGGRRFYRRCDGAHGCELWSADARGEDARLVVDLWPGPRSGDPQLLSVEGNTLLFSGTDPDVGNELWELTVDDDGGTATAQPSTLRPARWRAGSGVGRPTATRRPAGRSPSPPSTR